MAARDAVISWFVGVVVACGTGPHDEVGPVEVVPVEAAAPVVLVGERTVPPHREAPWTDEELAKLGLRELHLVRNTIYARAGQVFVKAWLREHFEAQAWYESDPEGVALAELSAVDRDNLRRVVDHEVARTEADHRGARRELARRLEGGQVRRGDATELLLLARALGEDVRRWPEADLLGPERTVLDRDGATPLDAVSMLEGDLVEADLDELSGRDLRLLRALLEARRGRGHTASALKALRTRYALPPVDPTYARDTHLTAIDLGNLALIDALMAVREQGPTRGEALDEFGPEAGWFYGS